MFKLTQLSLLTLLTVPLLPLPSLAQGFEPFPNPSASDSPPPSTSTPAAKPGESPYFRSRAKNLARQAAERANGGLRLYRAEPAMSGPALTAPYVENADGSLTFSFKGGAPGATVLSTETVATVYSNGAVQLNYNGPVRGANIGGAQLPAPGTPGFIPAPPPPASSTPAPPVFAPAPPARTAPAPLIPAPPVRTAPAPSQRGLPPLRPQSSTSPQQPVTILPFDSSQSAPSATALPFPSVAPQPVATAPQSVATAPVTVQPLLTTDDQGLTDDLFLARAKNLARQAAIQTNGGLGRYRPDPRMFGPATQAPFTKNADGSITFKFRGGAPGAQTQSLESEITVAKSNVVTINYNGPARQ